MTISSLRRLYRSHLSRFALFRALRGLVASLHGGLFRLYTRLMFHVRAEPYRLAAAGAVKTNLASAPIVVEPAQTYVVSEPRFVGFAPPDHEDKTFEIKSPPISVMEFKDATAIGGTTFLLSNGFAVHPDLYRPAREVCPAETHGFMRLQPGFERLKLYSLKHRRVKGQVASILGQCAGNYAHWMTEVMPKLVVLNALPEYRDLPLLVDGWVHPNFHEALEMLNRGQRKIIMVDRWEQVHADSIVDVSPTAYIPAEYRDYLVTGQIAKLGADEFVFSKPAILRTRRLLLAAANANGSISRSIKSRGTDRKKRLYIRRERSGNERKALNADAAETIAREYGLTPIEPGAMTIAQQIELFADAELVAGQIGAALTNLIFTTAPCKVIAMAPYYPNANYYFWSNLLGLLGHELFHVVGPQVSGSEHVFHRSYEVDLSNFRKALNESCGLGQENITDDLASRAAERTEPSVRASDPAHGRANLFNGAP